MRVTPICGQITKTELDFLNFTGVADTVAEIIVQAQGSRISIGVSGAWGVGKSSMIRLIRRSLDRRQNTDFIFVEFNAWLYQGYDDARAALLEVIADKLTKEAESRKKGVEKAKEFHLFLCCNRLWFILHSGVAEDFFK